MLSRIRFYLRAVQQEERSTQFDLAQLERSTEASSPTDAHATAQAEDEVQRRLRLDVVVAQGAAILQRARGL